MHLIMFLYSMFLIWICLVDSIIMHLRAHYIQGHSYMLPERYQIPTKMGTEFKNRKIS